MKTITEFLHHSHSFDDLYRMAEYYGIYMQRKLIGESLTEAFNEKKIKFIFK